MYEVTSTLQCSVIGKTIGPAVGKSPTGDFGMLQFFDRCMANLNTV